MVTKAQTAAQKALETVVEDAEAGKFAGQTLVLGEAPAENVVEAWRRVLRDMPAIGKDNRMSQGGGYNYRSIEQFTAAAATLMARHGCIVLPRGAEITYVEVGKTSSGNVIVEARGTWDWRIFGPGGRDDYIDGASFGQGRDSSDKAANKAATAAFKYFLMPSLMISDSKEDPDHERIETSLPEPSPAQQEQFDLYLSTYERAKVLRDLDEKYIEALRTRANAAGFTTVNDWGRAHTDDFLEAVIGLEELAKQAQSGEPEEAS